jgi:hypothetical protein
MTYIMLGLFNLGGGEIVLILALLAMLLVVPSVLAGVIFLIIRMSRKSGACASALVPPPIQSGRSWPLVFPMTPKEKRK